MKETKAEAGTVIVLNPRTGEILALANRPTFNPNNRREVTNEALKNRAVTDIYEPGSTFKIVTVAAALEEKLTRPDEVFDCQMGSIVINGMRIRDQKALWTPAGDWHHREFERRRRYQDCLATWRRTFLQVHSRIWLRSANRNRAPR